MPSAFDKLFAAAATPTLMATFGTRILIRSTDGDIPNELRSSKRSRVKHAIEVDAQVGRETIRRMRTGDGVKIVRTREVLIARDAIVDWAYSSPVFGGDNWDSDNVLKAFQLATIEHLEYAVTGYDRAPGNMVRLTLERSDPSGIHRPNLRGRR